MSDLKLTEWLPAYVEPTMPGVYQRLLGDEVKWARWDGQKWMRFEISPYAASLQIAPTCYHSLKWRGLAEAASNENSQRGSEA